MADFVIAGLGELLWDVLPGGEALGGAPANFSYHVNSLGGRGVPVSTVGKDARGELAREILQKKGVTTDGIAVTPEYPTGWVDAVLDRDGVATYNFPPDVAWDHLQINDFSQKIRDSLDAVCFGSLAQRNDASRQAIYDYLDGIKSAKTLRVFDANLRQNFFTADVIEGSLRRADVLKLNDDELTTVGDMFFLQGSERDKLSQLRKRFTLELVILTRGDKGSLLLTEWDASDYPGIETNLRDTIGAGDSFTAAATIGYLQRKRLDDINEHANRVAAYVCTQPGAMPEIPRVLAMS